MELSRFHHTDSSGTFRISLGHADGRMQIAKSLKVRIRPFLSCLDIVWMIIFPCPSNTFWDKYGRAGGEPLFCKVRRVIGHAGIVRLLSTLWVPTDKFLDKQRIGD
jgi:hypothetical protein